MDTFRVRIEDLRLPANVPAGCNYLVVASLTYQLRATTEDPPPIEVTLEPDGTWRIAEGRHRYLAAVIAGRGDILCTRVEVTPCPPMDVGPTPTHAGPSPDSWS